MVIVSSISPHKSGLYALHQLSNLRVVQGGHNRETGYFFQFLGASPVAVLFDESAPSNKVPTEETQHIISTKMLCYQHREGSTIIIPRILCGPPERNGWVGINGLFSRYSITWYSKTPLGRRFSIEGNRNQWEIVQDDLGGDDIVLSFDKITKLLIDISKSIRADQALCFRYGIFESGRCRSW